MRNKKGELSPIQLIMNFPITEEWVYKIISKHPYAFDHKYFGQFVTENHKLAAPDSKLGQALRIVGIQKQYGRIRQSSDGAWRVTMRGNLYLLYSHRGLAFWSIVIGALVSIVLADRFACSHTQQKLPATERRTPKTQPSGSAYLFRPDSLC